MRLSCGTTEAISSPNPPPPYITAPIDCAVGGKRVKGQLPLLLCFALLLFAVLLLPLQQMLLHGVLLHTLQLLHAVRLLERVKSPGYTQVESRPIQAVAVTGQSAQPSGVVDPGTVRP